MKNLLIILLMFIRTWGFSQELKISNSLENEGHKVADTLSYEVLKNENNQVISIGLRKKIEINRRDIDYIWKPEDGLEILIYKK